MELFKMTCEEVQKLKNDNIEHMIKFNRDLKVNYSSIKEQTKFFKTQQSDKVNKYALGNFHFLI